MDVNGVDCELNAIALRAIGKATDVATELMKVYIYTN